MPFETIPNSLRLTAEGVKDTSGKTPLDRAIESIELDSEVARNAFSDYLVELFPRLTENGPEYVKLGRYLVRRTGIRTRRLADALRILLAAPIARRNREVRLWLMLTLMDMGFPPTIAILLAEQDLRSSHTGEWLTLVAASESYADVKDAFVKAASDGLMSAQLLTFKIDSIRRQFGDKLYDFLISVVPVLSTADQELAVGSLKSMYGIDLAPKRPKRNKLQIKAVIMRASFTKKTISVLRAVRADAERRAESRHIA